MKGKRGTFIHAQGARVVCVLGSAYGMQQRSSSQASLRLVWAKNGAVELPIENRAEAAAIFCICAVQGAPAGLQMLRNKQGNKDVWAWLWLQQVVKAVAICQDSTPG